MSDEQTLGTARVDVVVDTSKFDAAITSAKSKTADMSQAAQQAYAGMSAAQQKQIDSLNRQINALGKTRAELLQMKAAAASLPASVYEDFKSRIDKASVAVEHFSLKSSLARRELGRLASDMVNGNWGRFGQTSLTLANYTGLLGMAFSATGLAVISGAAALGLFVVGAIKGTLEMEKLRDITIATGGALGENAAMLNEDAVAAGAATGKWSEARKAIEALAASGSILGGDFQSLGKEAVNFSTVTGQSVDEAVKAIIKLNQEPAEQVAALNEKYHFLTSAQYAHIAALEKEGEKEAAAREANTVFAQAMDQRMRQVREGAGQLVQAGDKVSESWDKAWDAIKDGGRDGGLGDKLRYLEYQKGILMSPKVRPSAMFGGVWQEGATEDDPRVQKIDAEIKKIKRERKDQETKEGTKASEAKKNADAISAQKELAQFAKPKTVLDRTLKEADQQRSDALYGVSDQDRIKEIQDEYENKVQKAKLAYAAATKKLAGPDDFAELRNLVTKAGIDDTTFGSTNNQLTEQVERIQSIVEAGAKLIRSGHDVKQVQAEVGQGVAYVNELYAKQADQLQKKNAAAVAAYVASLDKQNAALALQYTNQAQRIGMGEKEYEQAQAIASAWQDQANKLEEIAAKQKEFVDTKGSSGYSDATAQQMTQALHEATEQRVRIIQDGYAQVDAMQAQWKNGAIKALEDYRDEGTKVASLTDQFFTNSFDAMGSALANFVTTGKLNFKSLATSILADLARMELRIVGSRLLQEVLGMFVGVSYGGGDGAATGSGLFSGFGSSGTTTTTFNAKGGVYSSPSLSAYSNGVYNSPQLFAFAKGAGVFGEAGPEAIMPLRRDSSGNLGVVAGGGASNSPIYLTVQTNVDNAGNTHQQVSGDEADALSKQLTDRMASVAKQTVATEIRPGGLIYKMNKG